MTYLVLRFSSLGNVAMSVPVITSLSRRYPNDRFVVVARNRLAAMFYGLPNVLFHEVDFQGGVKSILRIYHELRSYHIDAVVDLQDNLRSYVLRNLFRLQKKPVYVINYGRNEKRHFIRRGYKHCAPLKTEFQRYAETFRQAGLQTDNDFTAIPVNMEAQQAVFQHFGQKDGHWIGIAPFAKNRSNMVPFRTTKEVIAHYSRLPRARVYLFGAGRIECEMLRQWASIFPNVVSVAGQLPLEEELELMRMLDVIVGMDSANQHLGALVGIRTISIWCGTHPNMGFSAWKQAPKDMLQTNLSCRPCTIHGTKKCKYHNFACTDIPVRQIVELIDNQ